MALDFVTAGVAEEPAGNSSITRSVNTGSADNRFLIVWFSAQHASVNPVPASCTYAGGALTPFTDGGFDGWGIPWRVRFFYMEQPPSGANNLVGVFDWDGVKIGMGWAVYSSDEGALTVQAQDSTYVGVDTNQVSTIASAVAEYVAGIHIQIDDGTPTNVVISPTIENFEGSSSVVSGWHMEAGQRGGASPTATIGWTNSTNQPYVAGLVSLGEAVATIEVFKVPTTAPDGTTRKLWVYTDTTLATPLVSNQTVVASGGFFSHTSSSGVIGQTYPAVIGSYGADATEDASGGLCWATVVEE